DHPNILRVYDTGIFGDYFYIEMEYIHGVTLREHLLRHGRISEKEVLEIALQVARALRYAHETELTTPDGIKVHGILHLDLKPENIMITPSMEVKLMDFGAAKMLLGPGPAVTENRVFGTLAYMSPEQIAGLPVDVKSDFFSFGAILYELISGHKAFPAEQAEALMEQVRAAKYEPVRRWRRAISPWTEELIDKLLAARPSHRPHSAAEMEKELHICQQLYKVWGTGARVSIPFSIRKHFPSIAITLSIAALVLSTLSFIRTCSGSPFAYDAPISIEAQAILDHGLALERAKDFHKAVGEYKKVPKGTREYQQAQARAATVLFRDLKQLSTARAILEALRNKKRDPYVDALLGKIYYQLALYPEAHQRLEEALESNRDPVLPLSDEDKDEMRYLLAWSWDREYQYLDKEQKILEEALKAWGSFYELAGCAKASKSRRCTLATKRKNILGKELSALAQ
ncbi:MAG TPA: serine/threonine-protein kinase, partial [Fibrobacteraceae bacterium]|nr:serine/threonine-protein kinase [Fibrobacteraceae bacterium]